MIINSWPVSLNTKYGFAISYPVDGKLVKETKKNFSSKGNPHGNALNHYIIGPSTRTSLVTRPTSH